MTAREKIREIVDQQLVLISKVSSAGPLSDTELAALQSLAKTALVADRLEVPKVEDPTDALSDAELEKAASG